MRKIRLLVVAALAASTMTVAAPPAQAQARCLPEYWLVCYVVTTVCRVTGNPCYA